jgi:acetyl-CoA C-acetyltransferase
MMKTQEAFVVSAVRTAIGTFGGSLKDVSPSQLAITLGVLHDPFHRIHMGLTAEAVAACEGVTREMQDALALESHRRAARAVAEGRFLGQIAAIAAVF